jgi:hypothetical protein
MTEEYTFRRINNYDIDCDDYINDVYSIFYKSFEIKNSGLSVVMEIVSKLNLNFNFENIREIMCVQKKCSYIFKINDVFDDEQNFYIVWDDFISQYQSILNQDLNDDLIQKIFVALKNILIFVIDNEIHCDSIIYDQIFYNKKNNKIKILLRPQKKKKNIIYGSPIYSPRLLNKALTVIEDNIVTNISILLYEICIKRISTKISSTDVLLTDLVYSDYSEFLSKILDPRIDYKQKSFEIRNTNNIKNIKNKNMGKDTNNNLDIFVMDL